MSTKNKLTDYQIRRIQKSISNALETNAKLDPEISLADLYEKSANEKRFEKFKSLFKYAIFTVKGGGISICTLLEFEFDDKDTIKVNEEISKTVEFLEKIFVSLDSVKINRITTGNNHYVIIKSLKNEIPEYLLKEESE